MLYFLAVEPKNGGAYCDTCKAVVGYVDQLVKDQKTEVFYPCSYLQLYSSLP